MTVTVNHQQPEKSDCRASPKNVSLEKKKRNPRILNKKTPHGLMPSGHLI
jgi:hypothetical protein